VNGQGVVQLGMGGALVSCQEPREISTMHEGR
jgi:hypothetical protein